MPSFEYKVVPAPKRAAKVRSIKGTEGRFAHALQDVMNTMGADGWEYQRTDTLPCEERVGLTGRTTVFQNMLVFRREIAVAAEAAAPRLISPPAAATSAPVVAAPSVRVAETLVSRQAPAPVRTDPVVATPAVTGPRIVSQ